MVEGGFTRFAAIYHSTAGRPGGPDPLGPLHRHRALAPLYHPLFSYSGANRDFKKLVRESSMVDVGVENFPGKYYRDDNGGKAPPSVTTCSPTPRRSTAWPPPDAQAPPAAVLLPGRRRLARRSPSTRPVSRAAATVGLQGQGPHRRQLRLGPGRQWLDPHPERLAARRRRRPEGRPDQRDLPVRRPTTTPATSTAPAPRSPRPTWSAPATPGSSRPATWSPGTGRRRDKDARHHLPGARRQRTPGSSPVAPGWSSSRSATGSATDRPADANDDAKPVAPPAPDGSGPPRRSRRPPRPFRPDRRARPRPRRRQTTTTTDDGAGDDDSA